MQNVTREQKIFIESQVLSAEAFAAHIHDHVGQIRIALNDPGFSAAELSQVVRTFQNNARGLVAILDRIQENLVQDRR